MPFPKLREFIKTTNLLGAIKERLLGPEPIVDELQQSLAHKLAALRAQDVRDGLQTIRERRGETNRGLEMDESPSGPTDDLLSDSRRTISFEQIVLSSDLIQQVPFDNSFRLAFGSIAQ